MDNKRGRDSQETKPQDETTSLQDDEEGRDTTVERRELLQQHLTASAAGSAGSQLPAGTAAPSHGSQFAAHATGADSASRSTRDTMQSGEVGESGGRGRSSVGAARVFLAGPTRRAESGVERNKRESEGPLSQDEADNKRAGKKTRVEGRCEYNQALMHHAAWARAMQIMVFASLFFAVMKEREELSCAVRHCAVGAALHCSLVLH